MHSLLKVAVAAVLVVAAVGCTRRDDALAGDASTTGAVWQRRATPPAEPAPTTRVPPSQDRPDPGSATPPADSRLPPWVPESGRLTIIQAPDLARNLGLVDAAAPAAPPPPAPPAGPPP
jgi:hypothetical protein